MLRRKRDRQAVGKVDYACSGWRRGVWRRCGSQARVRGCTRLSLWLKGNDASARPGANPSSPSAETFTYQHTRCPLLYFSTSTLVLATEGIVILLGLKASLVPACCQLCPASRNRQNLCKRQFPSDNAQPPPSPAAALLRCVIRLSHPTWSHVLALSRSCRVFVLDYRHDDVLTRIAAVVLPVLHRRLPTLCFRDLRI
jgi:hypothetical protein